MAITFNDNLQVNAPKNVENRAGKFQEGTWRAFNSISEALDHVPRDLRYLTLTVPILEENKTVEYWFRDNLDELIRKTSDPEWVTEEW